MHSTEQETKNFSFSLMATLLIFKELSSKIFSNDSVSQSQTRIVLSQLPEIKYFPLKLKLMQ